MAKKAQPKAPAKKKPAKVAPKAAKKDASADTSIRRADASVRETQEAGSIAPPSKNLVSAFSLLKKGRPSAKGPTVARVAPGGSLPKPPAPQVPAAKPPTAPAASAPAALTPANATAPQPAVLAPKPPAKPATMLPTAVGPAQPAKPPVATFKDPAGGQAAPPYRPGVGRPPPAHRPAPADAKSAPKGRDLRAPTPSAHKPQSAHGQASPAEAKPKADLKKLEVSSLVTVRELAEKMEIRSSDVIKKLIGLGVFATINQRLAEEAAQVIAQEFGFQLVMTSLYKEEEILLKAAEVEPPDKLKPRPPVVTVMGHVDHGKTSLLDAIRQTKVAEGESGGITQHIGAYRVSTAKGDIVFLDTPGHAAFTAMRARGAKVTDIVVLVVSAVDGVMPQTIEAIDHAKAAGVPVVVAVNKIDLPGANSQKIRQELSGYGLSPEDWGGKTLYVDVSAKKRLHLDALMEALGLQAMMLDLKANPDRPGNGIILEARLDPKRGNLGTVLVQAGTITVGDSFVAGLSYGKIKAMRNDRNQRIDSAGPASPVEVLGLMGLPQAGDFFSVVADERTARDIASKRSMLHREESLRHQRHMTLVGLRSELAGAKTAKELKIIIKADVQGSLKALKDSLEGLSTSECKVRIIHSGLGNINESDVLLASASDAVSLLFHCELEPRAKELADLEGVEIRRYEIIYELIGDVKAALEGLLEPEIVEVVQGRAEVRAIFSVKGGRKAAGLFVRDGKISRSQTIRVKRGGSKVFEGKISSLKRFKDDVREVEKGLECGLALEGFEGFAPGDEVECVAQETRTRRLEPN